jgi:hypothetical protein
MEQRILAELVKLNATLDAMRSEQQAFRGKLQTALERIYDAVADVESAVVDVELAVGQLGGPLDEVADSLFEIQMQTMPGGDPREPMPIQPPSTLT